MPVRRPRPLLAAATLGATLLAVTAALVPTGAAAEPAPAPATGAYQEYVALGDSWSADVTFADTAGPPDTTHAPLGCAQSRQSYPKLLARELGVPVFRDATCGSATTDDFYAPQTGLPTGETNPPQLDRLSPTTDLVTVGIGGNDAGFSSAAVSCLSPDPRGARCAERYTAGGEDQLLRQIEESEPKLVQALRDIRARAPQARILVVDYLAAIPEDRGCYPLVPASDTDVRYLHRTFGALNAMVERAARTASTDFVDTFSDSLGHHVCSGPLHRYVEGLGLLSLNGPSVAVPAHPNSAGARSQFRSVLEVVRGVSD